MKLLRISATTLTACLLLTGCTSEAPESHDHDHAGQGMADGSAVWPPEEAMVFATTQVAIGDGSTKPAGRYGMVQGTVPTAGTVLEAGDRITLLEPGATTGELMLTPGEKQKVTFVELDSEGKIMADGLQVERTYMVRKNPAEIGVEWIQPSDGETLTNPIKARFKAVGYGTKAAGDTFDLTTGHHHILVNHDFTRPGLALPNDETHLHFGKGQEEAELTLPAGTHTLTLQFADGAHRSFGKPMSKTITVTVKE